MTFVGAAVVLQSTSYKPIPKAGAVGNQALIK